ncbi:MAG: uroporphyrinogen decarboxylase family protein [Chloroflexi bacterium]|nr:uroporphyrinogen decarboxylase family protein [Chloroflexota bacterium]
MARREEMTPLERVLAAAELREADRVPVLPSTKAWGIKNAGYKFAECYFDVDLYVDTQIRCQRELGDDGVYDIFSLNIEEDLGAQVIHREDDPPNISEPLLGSLDDLNKLVPYDAKTGACALRAHEMIRKLKDRTEGRVAVLGMVHSPFEIAATLYGAKNLYTDFIRNPSMARELMDFCVPMATSYAEALVEAGADIVRTVNPSANTSCISRRHYQEFAFPPMQKLFARLKARGIKILFHICGDWRDRLDLVCELGADILHVDRIDLARFKQEYGREVCVMGNVRTVETMLYGTPADVEREALDCIEQAAQGGGFILSADCLVPRDTPKENLQALVDVAITSEYPRQF